MGEREAITFLFRQLVKLMYCGKDLSHPYLNLGIMTADKLLLNDSDFTGTLHINQSTDIRVGQYY